MPTATSAPPSAAALRLIHLALKLGVLLFLVVAFVVRRGTPPPAADVPLHIIMLLASLPPIVVALLLRSRLQARRSGESSDAWWAAHGTHAIVIWALVESAGLMGVVGYWVTGNALPLAATAVAFLLFAMTAPARLAGE